MDLLLIDGFKVKSGSVQTPKNKFCGFLLSLQNCWNIFGKLAFTSETINFTGAVIGILIR